MWIKAERWNQLLADEGSRIRKLDEIHTRNIELERHNQFLQTTIDWMRTRLNQVELLNAKLIEKREGITPIVPQISTPNRSLDDILSDASELFTDPDEGSYDTE